jgi:hypothetical protein
MFAFLYSYLQAFRVRRSSNRREDAHTSLTCSTTGASFRASFALSRYLSAPPAVIMGETRASRGTFDVRSFALGGPTCAVRSDGDDLRTGKSEGRRANHIQVGNGRFTCAARSRFGVERDRELMSSSHLGSIAD